MLPTDSGELQGAGGLSVLSVWWLKLGIKHERIQPGHPEQNGMSECIEHSSKRRFVRSNFRKQQTRFDGFVREYKRGAPPRIAQR